MRSDATVSVAGVDGGRRRRSGASASAGLRLAALAAILFLHVPLALIVVYAFSAEEKSYVFPPPGLTARWCAAAWERDDVWRAIGLSLQVAAWSTAIALVLGTLAAAALARARLDRKSTRLNSSHVKISYAVFCLKKKGMFISC